MRIYAIKITCRRVEVIQYFILLHVQWQVLVKPRACEGEGACILNSSKKKMNCVDIT